MPLLPHLPLLPRFRSIRGRFLAGILLVAVPSLAVLAVLEDRYVTQLLEVVAVSEFSNDVLDGSDAIHHVVDQSRRELGTLARLVSLASAPEAPRGRTREPDVAAVRAPSLDALARSLEAALPEGSLFAELAVADASGRILIRRHAPDSPASVSLPALLGSDATHLAHLADDLHGVAVSSLRVGPAGHVGNQSLVLVTALGGAHAQPMLLIGLLSPAVLLRRVTEAPVSGGRVLFLADASGRVIAYTAEGVGGEIGARMPATLPYPAAIARQVLAGGTGMVSRGFPAIVAYAALDPDSSGEVPQWVLGEAMPRRLLLANIADLRRHTALVLALTAVVAVILAFFLARQITRPVEALRRGAERIAGGELDYPLTVTAEDEVGKLAAAFQAMTGSLRASLDALSQERLLLEQRVAERTTELVAQGEELAHANQALRSLDRLKSRFITNVSHELRTPMTMLQGALELLGLVRTARPEKVEELIGIAVDGVGRLSVIVQKILEYTDVDAGVASWKMQVVQVEATVAQVMQEMAPTAEERGIAFTARGARDLPPVWASAEKLKTALANLVVNALTFTPPGGVVTVTTGLVRSDAGALQIAIAVRDTGPGVSPEDVPRLLECFEQGGAQLTNKPQGLGLGLPIARRIAEHLGGEIRVESELGVGCTFTLCLPVLEVAPSAVHEERQAA